MNSIEIIRSHFVMLPDLAKFAVFMMLIAGAQPLARRLRVPPVVFLLLFGVVIGPYVLDIAGSKTPVASFIGEIGKLLLMFCAGLEIDLGQLRKSGRRSIIFGLATTAVPLVLGTAFALFSGYATIVAIVIGSLLASHTLLALPIVTRLGILSSEPVVISIGATVMSDTLSLIVFTICVSTYTTGFSPGKLALLLAEIAVFIPLIVIGLGRLGTYGLRKVQGTEDTHFALTLGIMGLAALLAHLIQLPGIVGAFLAGLAVNTAVQHHASKERLSFLGNALFIPVFFMVTGFLINPKVFASDIANHFGLVAGIVGSLLLGKAIAAFAVGRAFGYSATAQATMWAMTLPQVAATLAVAVVGYNTIDHTGRRMLTESTLNAVLVLMVVTAILGPVLTQHFAPKLRDEAHRGQPSTLLVAGRRPTLGDCAQADGDERLVRTQSPTSGSGT
jgi:Kef-type K+ transport system membrane component KefB